MNVHIVIKGLGDIQPLRFIEEVIQMKSLMNAFIALNGSQNQEI